MCASLASWLPRHGAAQQPKPPTLPKRMRCDCCKALSAKALSANASISYQKDGSQLFATCRGSLLHLQTAQKGAKQSFSYFSYFASEKHPVTVTVKRDLKLKHLLSRQMNHLKKNKNPILQMFWTSFQGTPAVQQHGQGGDMISAPWCFSHTSQ